MCFAQNMASFISLSFVRFEQAFQALLDQLQPVCVAEQKFCTSFFHLAKPRLSSDFDDTDGIPDEEVGEVCYIAVVT